MVYIDTSVLPSLADTFRQCGELMSGIEHDLKNYLSDVSHKFHEQSINLAERTDKAARQLKEAKERQEAAIVSCNSAASSCQATIDYINDLEERLRDTWRNGKSYPDERKDLRQQIRGQYEILEGKNQDCINANANFEQANIELQNAQSTYDDAKYRLEASKRIVEDFDKLHDQYRARLNAPNKEIRIDDRSIRVSQNYSIKTMLDHLSKDYVDKVVVALDAVQQKVDAILSIGQKHFGCDIAPTRAVVSATGGSGDGPQKNIIVPQASNEIFCPKCRQLKAICRCNEIIDKTIRSYIQAKEKIQELEQQATELKAKIDQLQPFEDAFDSIYRSNDSEIERLRTEKKNLLNEFSTRESNIDTYWKDGRRALVQAAWEREKDDERVYRSPEMDALWDEVDGMRKENRLLETKAYQLDDLMEKKRYEAIAAAGEKRQAQALEERRLGGTLGDFKKEYKRVISRLESLRKRKVRLRKMLKNYGVKIDNESNIITVQNE